MFCLICKSLFFCLGCFKNISLSLHEDSDFSMIEELQNTTDLREIEMMANPNENESTNTYAESSESDTDDDEPLVNTFPLWESSSADDDVCRHCLNVDSPMATDSACDNWVQCRECKSCKFLCVFLFLHFLCAFSHIAIQNIAKLRVFFVCVFYFL